MMDGDIRAYTLDYTRWICPDSFLADSDTRQQKMCKQYICMFMYVHMMYVHMYVRMNIERQEYVQ